MSTAQERMWFLERLYPGTAAYNVTSAIRLRGEVAVDALQGALMTLVERHKALRSYFPFTGESPFCAINGDFRLILESIEPARKNSAEQGIDAVPPEIERFAARPFDLAAGPLLRAGLQPVSSDEHIFVLVMHHLISDGWSLGVLHSELAALYNSATGGKAIELAPVEGDYAEYVCGERGEMERGGFAEGLTFWAEALDGIETLELPTDRPRPALQTLQGDRRIAYLPEPALERLESLARSCSSSLFMVLQAAFAVLLHRYTGQEDLVIGSPVANRDGSVGSGVVGLFVNTIVLRSRLEGNPSFKDLLLSCRDSTLEAIEHGDVPFESVVEQIQPERSLSHNPLFQVMFALQSAEAELPSFDGLEATLLDPDLGSTRFDLECTTWREPQRLKIRLTYSSDLFDGVTGERMLEHYVRLLEGIANDPEVAVGSLDLLSRDERQELLSHRAVLEHPDFDRDIPALFDIQAGRTPGALALETGTRSLSYLELKEEAERVAAGLQARGAGPEDVVAVRVSRDAEMIIAMLGVMKSGAALLPLDPAEPPARSRHLLADSGARIALAEDLGATVPVDGVLWVELGEMKREGDCEFNPPDASVDRLAYLIYTSGSSGLPKGVLVAHRSAVNTLIGCREWFGFDAEDLFLCIASQTFDIFYFELLSPLLSGGSVRLVDRGELFDPDRVRPLVMRATVMQAVPSLMKQIVEMLGADGATAERMRHVITGGDAVPAQLPAAMADAFPQAQVAVLYGPTEAAMVCSGVKLKDPRAVRGHPIGQPLPNVALRIYDEHRRLAPVGVAGEIYIGGPGVCRGYLASSSELAGKFVEVEGERFYRSGDRGRWGNDGGLEFLGRLDKQIKVRGFRIEPAEIEAALESHPGVREVAVVGSGEEESRRLVAFAALDHSDDEREAAERRHAEDWRALFDTTHDSACPGNEGHDFTGWHSSYTKEALAREQMEDWLEGCLAEARARLPLNRRGKARVLEIGCGTGLLLLELAGECERYTGTDFSERVLEGLRHRVRERGLANVDLHQRMANSLEDFEGEDFDLVILNSVVQYLPSLDYLTDLLKSALRCLRPDGFLFVGDVRNFALYEPFLAGVDRHWQGEDGLRERVQQRGSGERELLVTPAYFAGLEAEDNVAHVDIPLRRGVHDNELTRYRYNAIVYAAGQAESSAVPDWVDWESSEWSMAGLVDKIRDGQPDLLAVSGVSNALLTRDLDEWARASGKATPTASHAVHPGRLRRMAEQLGYDLATSWARGSTLGCFDIVLSKQRDPRGVSPRWRWPRGNPPSTLANDPVGVLLANESIAQARIAISETLPAHMIPSTIQVVESLPTTRNGKIDRARLSELGTVFEYGSDARTALSAEEMPVTELESTLAKAWEEVLATTRLSRNANFFSNGGTSLLAIRVAVRLRSRGIEVSAQDLFRHQSIAALSTAVERRGTRPGSRNEPEPQRPSRKRRVQVAAGAVGQGPGLADAKSILLTGATGFLGIHLLHDLLARTEAKVTCLVRGTDDSQAESRLAELWAWYFGDSDARSRRIEVLAGDIGARGLGVDPRAWDSIARRSEHVIHAAADVRHVGDEAEIFRTNLDGTRNVVEVAASERATTLHHISTIGVKGLLHDVDGQVFTERDFDIGQIPTEHYSASKLAAERVVREFFESGGAGTVLRVGTIAPHSVSGRFQHNGERHFFLRYLHATTALGLASHWPGRSLALAPVDALATACILLADTARPGEETFNLVTPHLLTHYDIVQLLQGLGYAIRLVEPDEFREQVWRMAQDRRYDGAIGGVLGLIDPPAGDHVPLDSTWTNARLREAGFEFPKPTATWFARFVKLCILNEALPSPLHWGDVSTFPEMLERELE